jgi:hypothetical protein
MTAEKVAYLIFDVESVADGTLVANIRYPGEGLDAQAATRRYRDALMEQNGRDFIPYTFQIPVSIVVAKVSDDFRLLDVVALDAPEFRSHVMTDLFWRGWEAYRRPALVSFNGRGFDLPLLELAAFRYGLNLGGWINMKGPNYTQPRYRYNTESHLDLCELLTNFGASRLTGGLNLIATILGKPGKMEVQGDMVQDLFEAGKLAEINDYCCCDVLDTYFVFLRFAVMSGWLELAQEQAILAESKEWLVGQAESSAAYRKYLDHWGDWQDPRAS